YRAEQGKLYNAVEEAGFSEDAWATYFGEVRRIAEEMHRTTVETMEATRSWLAGELPDAPRWAQQTNLEWLRRILAADPDEIQRMRSLSPGSPEGSGQIFAEVIEGNRLYVDQADAHLYQMAHGHPTIDTADILVSQAR